MVESEEEEDKKPRGEGGVKKAREGSNGGSCFCWKLFTDLIQPYICVPSSIAWITCTDFCHLPRY